jgi:hypothetical protein
MANVNGTWDGHTPDEQSGNKSSTLTREVTVKANP